MARKPDDPAGVSPDEINNLDADSLRALLARSDAAELFNAETRARIGRAIALAVATRPPPQPVPQVQQMQQQEQRPAREEGEKD
jgi:hypothetical protein